MDEQATFCHTGWGVGHVYSCQTGASASPWMSTGHLWLLTEGPSSFPLTYYLQTWRLSLSVTLMSYVAPDPGVRYITSCVISTPPGSWEPVPRTQENKLCHLLVPCWKHNSPAAKMFSHLWNDLGSASYFILRRHRHHFACLHFLTTKNLLGIRFVLKFSRSNSSGFLTVGDGTFADKASSWGKQLSRNNNLY